MHHDDETVENLRALGLKPTTEKDAKDAIRKKIMSEGEDVSPAKSTAKEVINEEKGPSAKSKSNALRNTLIGSGVAAGAIGAGMYMRNRDKQNNNSI